ncbi:lactoylglutathione lyase [Vibrio parahaemolyticus]|nr:lactoylglutathione lyase [Vibrio parahaemolyticus]TOR39204.1 lactoylglutathione lyase [Vibrio parahaemolyticus]
MRKLRYSVPHTLTRRYMHGRVQWKKESERGKSKSAL